MTKRRNATSDRRDRDRLVAEGVDTCWVCGLPLYKRDLPPGDPSYTTLEHAVALRQGGSNRRSNLRLAHVVCNNLKDNQPRVPTSNLLTEWATQATMFKNWHRFDEFNQPPDLHTKVYLVGRDELGVVHIKVGPYTRKRARKSFGSWCKNHPDLVWEKEFVNG